MDELSIADKLENVSGVLLTSTSDIINFTGATLYRMQVTRNVPFGGSKKMLVSEWLKLEVELAQPSPGIAIGKIVTFELHDQDANTVGQAIIENLYLNIINGVSIELKNFDGVQNYPKNKSIIDQKQSKWPFLPGLSKASEIAAIALEVQQKEAKEKFMKAAAYLDNDIDKDIPVYPNKQKVDKKPNTPTFGETSRDLEL